MDGWQVRRTGSTLRVEAAPDALDHVEDVVATVDRSIDDSIEVVRVSGPVLEQPQDGLATLLREVGEVAERYGKRFQVGPI
jgi:hypothetical protein